MQRRKAFAAAGAVSATALVGVLALGANIGLFGLTSRTDGPGEFQIVEASEVVPVTEAGTSGSSVPPVTKPRTAPIASTTAPTPSTAPVVRTPTSTLSQAEHEDEPEHEQEEDD